MAISFIGSAIGVTTATMPAHQAGDLILVFAYNDAAATNPTIAASFSTINAPAAGNSNGHRLAYKLATSAAESVGTWTNATQLVVQIYRGVDPANPIGASANLSGTTDVLYPALTLAVQDGTSWVAPIHGRRTGNVESAAVPPGTTMRSDTGTSGAGRVLGYDTNGGVASWPQLGTGGNNSFRYRSISVEMRAAPTAAAGGTGSGAATLGALTGAATGRLAVRGASNRMLAALTSVSAARLPVKGVAGGSLAPLTGSAIGRLAARGIAAVTLAPLTGSARISSPGQGTAAAVLAPLTGSATGTSPRRAQAAAMLAPLTAVGSATIGQGGTTGRGAGQLAALTSVSTGRLHARGQASALLGRLTSAAAGRLRIAGAAVVVLAALTGSATGRRSIPSTTPAARIVRVAPQDRVVKAR